MNEVDAYRLIPAIIFGPVYLIQQLRSTPPMPDPAVTFASFTGTGIWLIVALRVIAMQVIA